MLDKRKFYINGEWVAPLAANDLEVLNPATEKPVAVISMGSAGDIDRAVAAAKKAFVTYSRTTAEERLALLEKLLAIYKRRYEEMAQTITLELGAPLSMSREQQADVGVGHLQGFIDALKRLHTREVLPNGDVMLREPVGVCGLITPWNWPINQIALKVVPALATGSTCVLKPSEFTPLNAMLYAEMVHEAGFPAGSFNLVNGDGLNVGAALSKHKDVDMMSFTGSTRAGIAVSKDAAETVKRVTLELGGKSPNIVFEDADLEDRVAGSVLECFNNSGQSCDAPTRLLVQKSVYDKAVEIATRVGKEAKVGNPAEEGSHIGPLVSDVQFGRVQALIEAGIAEGARVLRDTACNVAYWNLHQRELTLFDGGWRVDGEPLCFFHFSGINARDSSRLSKYTLAFQGEQCSPALRSLITHYVDQLRANGHGTVPNGTYAYARFASGTPIPGLVRQMYRDSHVAWCGGDPFESYEEFLHLPCAPRIGSSGYPISHLMRHVHLSDPELCAKFDLGFGPGVRDYSNWYVRNAASLIRDRRLVEPAALRIGHLNAREVRRRPPLKTNESEPDVNVIGYLRLALGLGEAGRQLLRAIAGTGVHARGLPVQQGSNSAANDHSMEALFDDAARAPVQIFSINADQLPAMVEHLGESLRKDSYRIVMPFWELEDFPQPWLAAFDLVDEIWAPTRYIQSMLTHKVDKPVIHMPLPLGFEEPAACERAKFGLPDEPFLFFFAFDYFSFVERKNPLAAVRAYKKAFSSDADRARTKLVIKTLNAEVVPEQGRALRDALRDDPDVIVIERTLSREETLQLVAACDAVVSLHRSEGLGLLVVEAMALGKPVIATDYSATTEFVSMRTGWPVDFDLVKVGEGEYPFHEGQSWARPDEDHAAWQMRQVVCKPAEAARRATAARQFLQQGFGAEACAARLTGRFDELNNG